MEARHHIKLDMYVKNVGVELAVARRMLSTQVLPAAIKYQNELASAINQTKSALGEEKAFTGPQEDHLKKVSILTGQLIERIHVLENDEKEMAGKHGVKDHATLAANQVRPHIWLAREISDQLELLIDEKYWPFPSYDELLRVG